MTIDKFGRSSSTIISTTSGVSKSYVNNLVSNPTSDTDFQNTYTCINVKDPVNDQDVATKLYVDNSGSNPIVDIDFQNTYTCINVKDPVNDQDVATKSYVDSMGSSNKAYITVTAEKNGSLTAGAADFSFGHGTRNTLVGKTMLYPGRVLKAGISMYPSYTYATVGITVNGVAQTGYEFSKQNTSGIYKGQTTRFSTPLELNIGDQFNFVTVVDSTGIQECVVNVIIEIDLDS